MATERVIDLTHQRYADREYTGPRPERDASGDSSREHRRARARGRLLGRVRQMDTPRRHLDRTDLLDLLILLGEEDW